MSNDNPQSRINIRVAACLLAMALPASALAAPALLSAESVNDVGLVDAIQAGASTSAVLRAQILLDRAHFSPGEIDGGFGSNTRKAIAAYQQSQGLDVTGVTDAPTWAALNAGGGDALVEYTLTQADVAGPFEPVPVAMADKTRLEKLGYESVGEALGEQFHASPRLLARLNPDKPMNAGTTILVPNVATAELPKATRVVVDKSDSAVTLLDADGKVYAHFPASTGSKNDPLPLGEWKIQAVAMDPTFHYNPKLFWDANPSDKKAVIPPGPNNPVGRVWVDLSKEHYGIHGTPVPGNIGKTESHGCIRLTNWTALALAGAVTSGMTAVLQE